MKINRFFYCNPTESDQIHEPDTEFQNRWSVQKYSVGSISFDFSNHRFAVCLLSHSWTLACIHLLYGWNITITRSYFQVSSKKYFLVFNFGKFFFLTTFLISGNSCSRLFWQTDHCCLSFKCIYCVSSAYTNSNYWIFSFLNTICTLQSMCDVAHHSANQAMFGFLQYRSFLAFNCMLVL